MLTELFGARGHNVCAHRHHDQRAVQFSVTELSLHTTELFRSFVRSLISRWLAVLQCRVTITSAQFRRLPNKQSQLFATTYEYSTSWVVALQRSGRQRGDCGWLPR